MEIHWTGRAYSDLKRLYDFLAPINPGAAAKVVQLLPKAPDKLVEFPRMGERVEEFLPREVRRLILSQYEMRYELTSQALYILRIWHTRERR